MLIDRASTGQFVLAETFKGLVDYANTVMTDVDTIERDFMAAAERMKFDPEVTRLAERHLVQKNVLRVISILECIKNWDSKFREVERTCTSLLKSDQDILSSVDKAKDLVSIFKPLEYTAELHYRNLAQGSMKLNQVRRLYHKIETLITLNAHMAYRTSQYNILTEIGREFYESWMPKGIAEITERVCQAAFLGGALPYWMEVVNAKTQLKISHKTICDYIGIYDIEFLGSRGLLRPIHPMPPINYGHNLSAAFVDFMQHVKSLDLKAFVEIAVKRDFESREAAVHHYPELFVYGLEIRLYQMAMDTIMATLKTEILDGIAKNIDTRANDRNKLPAILQEKLTTLFSHYYTIEVRLPRVGLSRISSHLHRNVLSVFRNWFLPMSLNRTPNIPKFLSEEPLEESPCYSEPGYGKPLIVYIVRLALDAASARFESVFGHIGNARDLQSRFDRINERLISQDLWNPALKLNSSSAILWIRDCQPNLNHLGMRWLVMKLCGLLERIGATWENDRRSWGDGHVAAVEALAFSRTVVARYVRPILVRHWNENLTDSDFESDMSKCNLLGDELSWFCQRNRVNMNMDLETALDLVSNVGTKLTDQVRNLAVRGFTESIEASMMKYVLVSPNLSSGVLESAIELIDRSDNLKDVLALLPRDLQMIPSDVITSSIAECMTLLGRLLSFAEFGRDEEEKTIMAHEIKNSVLPAILIGLTRSFIERLGFVKGVGNGWSWMWRAFVDTHHMLMHIKILGSSVISGSAELSRLTQSLLGIHEKLVQCLVEIPPLSRFGTSNALLKSLLSEEEYDAFVEFFFDLK